MDMRLAERVVNDVDFYEGVRTVLVEKGAKAVWKYKSIDDVPQKEVAGYFEKLEKDLEIWFQIWSIIYY